MEGFDEHLTDREGSSPLLNGRRRRRAGLFTSLKGRRQFLAALMKREMTLPENFGGLLKREFTLSESSDGLHRGRSDPASRECGCSPGPNTVLDGSA
jgi:hypothetical protein